MPDALEPVCCKKWQKKSQPKLILIFLGPEPSFQAPHQHQPIEQPQEPDEDEADEGPPNETPEQR